jgi:hypothetical protein
MERQLEEYSAIIRTQEDTISSMTPPTIAKQWVKNKDKKGGHVEWTVGCDKLVIELFTNRVPPSSIQASILVMARSFFHGHDVVCELPCLKSIRNMVSTLLRTTKSLAAYWLGSADSWKQLHTNKTSPRQISLVNVVIGLLVTNGVLKSICLSRSIIAEDSSPQLRIKVVPSYLHSMSLHSYLPIGLKRQRRCILVLRISSI